ncbi:hypothetical protein BDL97_19G053700 [Sphagnum fallax]|nr:hypothetical protein BDL97_19G053700 [Sphagnum fallax]
MSSGAPCGACKFLRRKCVRGCIFAPYFGADQGAARFAAVHKIFGASNVAKLLMHIPMPRRCDAVLTISYEAQARLSDPVYGCVATIFALQQQVASLQAELDMVQAQLADRHAAAAAHQLQQQQQHQQQQQQQQMGGLSFSPGQAHDYMQQQFDQSSELNMQQPGPTSALSMSLASSSDSAHNYLRIKEEETRPYHAGMQQHDFQYGIMLSNPLEPMPHQALIDSMERPRSGALSDHQPADHDGELQALAHSLLRRPK